MTKALSRALEDGYTFTGIYTPLKEVTRGRAAKLRKEGYMVRVIFEPSSKYARGGGGGGYSAYSKPTKKKAKELEAEKMAKERQRLNDLMSITTYLQTRNRVELLELFKEAKGGERELLYWAKEKTII